MRKSPPAPPPEEAIYADLVRVPMSGSLIVRFLSDVRVRILTHWVHKRSVACPGAAECPTAHHRAKTTWKGFAEALYWRDGQYQDWARCVLEVTERLYEEIHAIDLPGTMWHLARVVGDSGYKEVSGREIAAERLSVEQIKSLRNFCVESVIFRIFRTQEIAMDQTPQFPARVRLEPVKMEAPPGRTQQALPFEEDAEETARKNRESLAAARERWGKKS